MPRKTTPEPPTRPRLVLAASSFATRVGEPAGTKPPALRTGAWQRQAWDYYNSVGELHYAATFIGRGLSAARLFIAHVEDDGTLTEVETGPAADLSRDLLGGPDSTPELLYNFGIQRTIAGQSLLTVHDDNGWNLYPDTNFTVQTRGRNVSYTVANDKLPPGTLAIHLWTAHPGDILDIDSPVRAALPILREITQLDAYMHTTLLSRIATAGILQIPDGATYPELEDVPEGVSPFMHLLQTVMTTAIQDPNSAAARVPVTVEVPTGEKLEHLALEFPLTDSIDSKREAAIRRLAMSMDMPPEILMGMATTNRSTSWQIDESAVKMHIEPALREFTAALTAGYVQPVLDDESYVVGYDISALQQRPDRTDAAVALYDRGEIDGEALREETGLRDYEPPAGEQLLIQLLKAALRTNPALLPDVAPYLARAGIKDLADELATPSQAQQVPSVRITPAQIDPPTRTTTDPATEERPGSSVTTASAGRPQLAALTAACDVMVGGLLATAGRRWVKARSHRFKPYKDVNPATIYLREKITADCLQVDESEVDRAIRYVGTLPQVERIAAAQGANPDCVREQLRDYVAGLLLLQQPHHPEKLRATLAGCVDG